MDLARYGSDPEPDPVDERRASRDRGFDQDSDWDRPGGSRPLPPRDRARGDDPLEQRLDRWVSRGRQLVDGVSGARPGSRQAAGSGSNRPGGRGVGIDGLGRWMENRFDWLLDDGDDWREPWQESDPPRRGNGEAGGPPPAVRATPPLDSQASPTTVRGGDGSRPRRPLEAVSLRGRGGLPSDSASRGGRRQGQRAVEDEVDERVAPRTDDGTVSEAWPEDEMFRLERWQRPARQGPNSAVDPAPIQSDGLSGRPLPRSTRRR